MFLRGGANIFDLLIKRQNVIYFKMFCAINLGENMETMEHPRKRGQK